MEQNIQKQIEDIFTPDTIPQPKEILAFICEHLTGALFAVDPTKLVEEIYKSGIKIPQEFKSDKDAKNFLYLLDAWFNRHIDELQDYPSNIYYTLFNQYNNEN